VSQAMITMVTSDVASSLP